MKKLEGLFGLKLGEVFDETKFEVTKKELVEEEYDIDIDLPPNPNLIFTNYGVSCEKKDMKIKRISANTLSPMAIDDVMERYEDLANFFIETYLISYAIFYYELEQYMHTYEFIPYDSKIIPFRRDYNNFVHPNEPSKQLIFTIFGESDYYKQVEIYLALKEEEPNIPKLAKIYQEEDLKAYDTGKGYDIDVTGL